MAVETPPFALQSGSFGAEQTRRALGALIGRGASVGSIAGGLVVPGDCLLTPPGSGMSVNVAPGEIWVPGTTSATQSGYYCRVSSSTSLSIAASDPTNPRIDTVIAQVQDAAYAGSTNSFQLAVVTGTPTAGATLGNLNGHGAVPASSLVIGYVLVPQTVTNIVSGDISNVAAASTAQNIYATGTLAARPNPGAIGRIYLATDTGYYYYDAGTQWIPVWSSAPAGPLLWPVSANVTNPSRVVNTSYQPNTTRPTLLTVCVVGGGSGSNTVVLKIGPSSPTIIAGGVTLSTAAGQVPITTIVPPGWFYEAVLSAGSATIPQVTEMTL